MAKAKKVRWTFERMKLEASKHETKRDFRDANPIAYKKMNKRGWGNTLFPEDENLRRRITREEALKVALRYNTRGELSKADPGIYQWIKSKGCMDEMCGHMNKAYEEWPLDRIESEARQFSSRGEFQKGSLKAYRAAQRRGALDHVCKHMRAVKRTWTEAEVLSEMRKHKTRSEASKYSSGAVKAAVRLGIYDKACAHMERKPLSRMLVNGVEKAVFRWTAEALWDAAAQYLTRTEFQHGCSGGYITALKWGILDEICAHMEPQKKSWPLEAIFEEASKYPRRVDFMRGSPGAYDAATRLGQLDEVCEHMGSERNYWTDDELRAEAKKYNTRGAFKEGSLSHYQAARVRGLLDEVCAHTKPGKSGFSPNVPHTLYYLRYDTDSGPLYKIGITKHEDPMDRFLSEPRGRITFLYTKRCETGVEARDLEAAVKKHFAEFKYEGDPILIAGGDTELFVDDVLGFDEEVNRALSFSTDASM